MKSIRAIIVDDEKAAREVLTSLIEFHDENVEILASCEDLPSAVEKIKELKPDVVFLDVQMPEYVGYEISMFFDEIDFEIVFVTAYDQYAIKAFEMNALDYLVKPVERARLEDTLKRLKSKVHQNATIEDYKNLLKNIKNNNETSKIVINDSGKRKVIQLEDIVAIQADGSYSQIMLNDGSLITVSKTVKYFESLLSNSKHFFRSHRAWLININYVSHILLTELKVTTRGSNVQAKISRNKVEELEKLL